MNLDKWISIVGAWWIKWVPHAWMRACAIISWKWEKKELYLNNSYNWIWAVAIAKDDSKLKVQKLLLLQDEIIDTEIIGEITKISGWNLDIVYAGEINTYYQENYPHIDDLRFEIVVATDENFITKDIYKDETKSTKNFVKKMNQQYARKKYRK